jgi:hypothetical protein
MSMRGFIGLSLTAMLAGGCGVAGQVDDGNQDPTAEGAFAVRCPDPQTDCTVSNGAGVYTEEAGFAGIGAPQYMITHFINNAGGGVSLEARYFDSANSTWQVTGGSVYYANYAGKQHLTVISVSESLTAPAWTIFDASTSSYVTVSDAQLLDLQIVIALDKLYTLDWDDVQAETMKATIHKFNMRWRLTGSLSATQYCYRADATKDYVVFQQGMAVNPVTARVTRSSTIDSYVTLSCRYGAIPTARLWGYPYRTPATTWYYDAALQMKRASYCADGHYYTHANTKIRVWDTAGIQTDPMTTSEIEAWWTPTGATCIGPMRHSAMGFSGWCGTTELPPCSTAPHGHLADAASPPGP